MKRALSSIGLLVLVLLWPGAGSSQRASDAKAETLVWEYMKNELRQGRRENGYWKRVWRTRMPRTAKSLKLGPPFTYFSLGDSQIERFIGSGDLLQSATMESIRFSVFDGAKLIGTVEVHDREGDWAWASAHNPATSADSLATTFQDLGSGVSLVGANHLGAFLVFTRADGERRVYFMYRSERFNHRDQLDADETMSYADAMNILVPAARELLSKRRPQQGN
jgi:hypothetical protein